MNIEKCPFCKVEPNILPVNPDIDGDDFTKIICQNDSCPAKVSVEMYGEGHKILAIEAWNSYQDTKQETPEEWEDRTGKVWDNENAVYYKAIGGCWTIMSHRLAKMLQPEENGTIIIATINGKPK